MAQHPNIGASSPSRLVPTKSGYATTRDGSRWYVSNSTRGTGLTGGTSFSATAPQLVIDTGTSNRLVPSTLYLGQTGTVAGGDITIEWAIDSAVRYSSGGTALTPRQTSFAYTGTSDVANARESAVASAASATIRYGAAIPWVASLGEIMTIDFEDAVEITVSQSILIWWYASTAAPTLFYRLEWIEETV